MKPLIGEASYFQWLTSCFTFGSQTPDQLVYSLWKENEQLCFKEQHCDFHVVGFSLLQLWCMDGTHTLCIPILMCPINKKIVKILPYPMFFSFLIKMRAYCVRFKNLESNLLLTCSRAYQLHSSGDKHQKQKYPHVGTSHILPHTPKRSLPQKDLS